MHFICKKMNLKTGVIDISIGNAHVYDNHISEYGYGNDI